MIGKWASRKRAQRAIPAVVCVDCGTTENLERHHADHQRPLDVVVVCQRCHIKRDQADGFRRKKKQRPCAVCAGLFWPGHSTVKTCSRACLSELGRRNAMKRWISTPSATTASDVSGTASFHNKPPSLSSSAGNDSLEVSDV